ncbi:hypothetical protein B0A52_08818 [Exophiala mesophila]|uniref:SnoaL-like domain-containing protein n=1 Tax=Exophiala mesophila TaxID=212818 RepID=A0A438MUP3_EXOME|nr:hypothetical protein B0A52_08818 [Exophiala mesophila]
MYADISKPPAALPEAKLSRLETGISLLPPLSRRGYGPGLIILVPDTLEGSQLTITEGVPSPMLKWAEEGYAVVEVVAAALEKSSDVLTRALQVLQGCDACTPKDKVGIVVYDDQLWNTAAPQLLQSPSIVGAVVYAKDQDKPTLASCPIPLIQHLAGGSSGGPERGEKRTTYFYPAVKSHKFATPFTPEFHYSSESVSHTRNLTFLKPLMGGPYFDLETIWDEHTYYEFADRSVEHTMSTMVQEPYVNHIPTITGGIGRAKLTTFYRDNFIFKNADDAELELISRTIGIDRVIDEFIFKFTHQREIDWLLPGIPPTGKYAQIPMMAVVNVRGDRLYHEHISWDQGTALRQIGLLPEYLPYPYPLPDGTQPGPNKVVEYRVPVAGKETADKLREKSSVPSNEMFEFRIREVDSTST